MTAIAYDDVVRRVRQLDDRPRRALGTYSCDDDACGRAPQNLCPRHPVWSVGCVCYTCPAIQNPLPCRQACAWVLLHDIRLWCARLV